jgi:alpha-1,2-mannosyltransferase
VFAVAVDADSVSLMSGRQRVVATVGVWVAAAAIAAVLGVQRFASAAFDGQTDLEGFFIPAAQAISAGRSPYSVEGYFYSPLVALLLAPAANDPHATVYWTALRIAAGITACVVTAIACAPRGAWLRAGVVACLALVTLLWSWPVTFDLWAGQVELLVLLALGTSALAETRRLRFLTGFALGIAAVVKTWPALFALWLVRSGARHRGREWLGILAAAALAVALTLATAGLPGLSDLIVKPLSGGDQPLLAANSVWGMPRLLFSETPMGEPLADSPILMLVLTALLATWVLALAVIAILRPGPPVVALYNIAFLVILLLPVSHYFYVLYALPALWWWGAHVLDRPRPAGAWVVFAVLVAWWLVVFRIPPAGDGFMTTTWPSLVRIFGACLVAVTVSVIGAAMMDAHSRRAAREPTVDAPEEPARLSRETGSDL